MKRPDTADDLGPFERAVHAYTSSIDRDAEASWRMARGTDPGGIAIPEAPGAEPATPGDAELEVAGALGAVTLTSPLLRQLDSHLLVELARHGELIARASGEALYTRGTPADALYFVASGCLHVQHVASRDPSARALRGDGDMIGGTALLSSSARAATVHAIAPSALVRVPVRAARDTLLASYRTAELFVRTLAQQLAQPGAPSLAFFAHASPSELLELLELFEWVEISPGDTVVRAGERADGFCLVLAGALDVVDDDSAIAQLVEGSVFGAASLLDGSPAATSIRATTDAWLLRLPPTEFAATVQRYPLLLEELAALVEELRI